MNCIKLAVFVVAVSMLQSAARSEEPQDPKVLAAENRMLQAQIKLQQGQIDSLKAQIALLQEKLKTMEAGAAPADPNGTTAKTPGLPATTKAIQPVDALAIFAKLANQCAAIKKSNATDLKKDDLIAQAYSEANKSFGEAGFVRARVVMS